VTLSFRWYLRSEREPALSDRAQRGSRMGDRAVSEEVVHLWAPIFGVPILADLARHGELEDLRAPGWAKMTICG